MDVTIFDIYVTARLSGGGFIQGDRIKYECVLSGSEFTAKRTNGELAFDRHFVLEDTPVSRLRDLLDKDWHDFIRANPYWKILENRDDFFWGVFTPY